jgi:hypothetical protein
VPILVAEQASSNDVAGCIGAPILTRHQMLRCASEYLRFTLSDSVLSSELSWAVLPHGETAVVAEALLASEGFCSESCDLGKFAGHERLLSSIRVPLVPKGSRR